MFWSVGFAAWPVPDRVNSRKCWATRPNPVPTHKWDTRIKNRAPPSRASCSFPSVRTGRLGRYQGHKGRSARRVSRPYDRLDRRRRSFVGSVGRSRRTKHYQRGCMAWRTINPIFTMSTKLAVGANPHGLTATAAQATWRTAHAGNRRLHRRPATVDDAALERPQRSSLAHAVTWMSFLRSVARGRAAGHHGDVLLGDAQDR